MLLVNFIQQLKSYRIFRLFYWFLKISLGLGFIISGMRKLPGVKFTQIPISDPVGLFFEGMYQSGFYWNFVGYYQILVGIILMLPFLKRLSPILIYPVMVNIWLVSLSLHMQGTPVITTLMLLGNMFLLLWHLESYLPLFRLKES